MLSLTVAKSQKAALLRVTRPAVRCTRIGVVRVNSSKKSREQELQEAYEEQLAYLERRRQRLISPRMPKSQEQVPAASASVVEPAPGKAKSKPKAAEPSIKIAQEVPKPKKEQANPLGFLSGLFGAK